jgi:hypothetical protein
MTSGEGASAFFTDVDRNVSPENPDLGKLISIGESHGLRFPLPPSRVARRQSSGRECVALSVETAYYRPREGWSVP